MKSITSLALLLLIQRVSSLPYLPKTDCYDNLACRRQQAIASLALPTQLHPSPPSPDTYRDHERFNNAPSTPSEHTDPTTALSSNSPLTSAYLMSLTEGKASTKHLINLQHAPATKEPHSPNEKTDTHTNANTAPPSKQQISSSVPKTHYSAPLPIDPNPHPALPPTNPLTLCTHYLNPSNYSLSQIGRTYLDNDILVVGIVLMFLSAVIIMEVAQKILEARRDGLVDFNFRLGNWFGWGSGRGEIFLGEGGIEDEEGFRKRFCLEPAPLGRRKRGVLVVVEVQEKGDESVYPIDEKNTMGTEEV